MAPPCKHPHRIIIQFAPCQTPLTKKVKARFKYARPSPLRLPPNGKYTNCERNLQVKTWINLSHHRLSSPKEYE